MITIYYMRLFYLKIALITGCLILSGVVFTAAQEDPFAELAYPISELGGCTDKRACEVYCSKTENMKACLIFAKIHNLLPKEEIDAGQRMLALGTTKGPGGCEGTKACEAHCDQIEHIKECIIFAEKNNLIPPDELQEARKVMQALDRGLIPPKCKGKKDCDIYCSQSEHMEECITFAKEAGLMPPEEFRDAEKVLEAIKKGAKPPNCQGKEKCDIYCSQPEHMAECMEFGIAAGFMLPEEVENARRMLEAIKKGVMPPKCQGKEECDVYCAQEEHFEECLNFAEAAGFMSPEDAERARKSGGKGPGGCKTKEECEAFCSKPENAETCIDFSVKMGDISPEEAERMRQGPTNQIPGGPGGVPVGPGGCTNPEECQKYCESNPEACRNFQPPVPSASGGEPGYAPVPPIPCEGENCPPPPEGFVQPPGIPPPSTTPDAGGNLPPGEYVPPAPPPPQEQPTSFLDSLLGLIIFPFKLLFR